MMRGYGAISDYNNQPVGWYPGEYAGKAVAKSAMPSMPAIPDWVKWAGVAVVAGVVLYGVYSYTR